MKDYTIKRVSVIDKRADGSLYKDSNGKPYVRVGIQVPEYGDKWVNGLFFAPSCPWKERDVVKLEIKPDTYNGKEGLKFELPKEGKGKANEEILNKLTRIELMVIKIGQMLSPKENKVGETDLGYPVDLEDVKF